MRRGEPHARCRSCGIRQAQVQRLCRRCWRAVPGDAPAVLTRKAKGEDLEALRPIVLPHIYRTRVIDGVEYLVQYDGT